MVVNMLASSCVSIMHMLGLAVHDGLSLQSIFGRGAAVNGMSDAAKGSRLLANPVGMSDSDSEAGQSDEGGADAEVDELLAAGNTSSEEDLDDEQLDQASTQLMFT